MHTLYSDIIHRIMDHLTPQEVAQFAAVERAIFDAAVIYVQNRNPAAKGYIRMATYGQLGTLAAFRCICGKVGWTRRAGCCCWTECIICSRRLPRDLCMNNVCAFSCIPRCNQTECGLPIRLGNLADYFILSHSFFALKDKSKDVSPFYAIECKIHNNGHSWDRLEINKKVLCKYAAGRDKTTIGCWNSVRHQDPKRRAVNTWKAYIRPLILNCDPDHWISRIEI